VFKLKFDPLRYRKEFKCLSKKEKRPPVYLDNACMTLKPNDVINSIAEYYENHPSCHNRAVHEFGEMTTKKVETSRELINKYINCRSDESIIFTKNTTESINMVSQFLSFEEGDIVVTTDMEHNSNMLPWQFLKLKKKVAFEKIPIDPKCESFDFELFERVLRSKRVKLVSIFHMSNITGMKLPIKEIVKLAHSYGALVLLDAAQSMAHFKVDVQELDVDFMAFSIHKMYGPTGVGVLYGKTELLKKAIPVVVGGEGIVDATYETCTLAETPQKFEVGLQNYAGIIGAGAAIKFLSKINLSKAHEHILKLNKKLTNAVDGIEGLEVIGPQESTKRNGIINLSIKNKKPEEIGLLLSKMERIMVRSGVHCGHSWFHKYNLTPSLRVSLAFYNTEEEIDLLINTLKRLMD
jgi:cysteine desulfurase/selenocysteine lyase